MHFRNPFYKQFINDEDGAVTVDWFVLTAAIVGLAIAAFSSARTGALSLSGKIDTTMSSVEINIP